MDGRSLLTPALWTIGDAGENKKAIGQQDLFRIFKSLRTCAKNNNNNNNNNNNENFIIMKQYYIELYTSQSKGSAQ